MGISTEIVADFTSKGTGQRDPDGPNMTRMRVVVKAANDALDPAKILDAFAHASFLRKIGFAQENGLPVRTQKMLGGGRGMPAAPIQDLPDGTIYLPELYSGEDVPNAADELRKLLKQAGFIAE